MFNLAIELKNALNEREDRELFFAYFEESQEDLAAFVEKIVNAQIEGEITSRQLAAVMRIVNSFPDAKIPQNSIASKLLKSFKIWDEFPIYRLLNNKPAC